MPLKSLSVVIPAYNESDRLPDTLRVLADWAPPMFNPIQIIVVDDGSTDNTASLVERAMRNDPRLEVVRAPHGGAMHALLRGYAAAKYDWVSNMESDCAAPPSEFERLAPFLEDHDIVMGSRQLRGSLGPIEGKSVPRRFISWAMSFLFRILFRCRVYDPQIGFKIIRKDLLTHLLPMLRCPVDGMRCAEMLVKSYGLGYSIHEVPIHYRHHPDSRLVPARPFKVIGSCLGALLRIWLDAAHDFQMNILRINPVRGKPIALCVRGLFGIHSGGTSK